ncbi:hypothetical protein EIKCOROL_00929 [Eikenella corrodens ATCC 23834]|uniref:Uncharacterized protein n=1 Tax=Eikenella corrodens ATCC 23834 TaxID=546274 RepID=C0DU98_EIKCO|nr:hypothetical protein EIKCOROL_00929 [Eikenella corrodens ATCC 23834]
MHIIANSNKAVGWCAFTPLIRCKLPAILPTKNLYTSNPSSQNARS